MKSICKRELLIYFTTPLGYIFLVIFLCVAVYLAFSPGLGSLYLMREAHLRPLFSFIPWIFSVLVPAVSMRLWAEERKSGTIELLLTLPVRVRDAILGKFLAAMIFLSLAVALTFPMVITVAYLGNPDWGAMMVGYLGCLMVGALFLCVGLFCSALTKSQVVSFILSVVICFVLLICSSPPVLDFVGGISHPYVVEIVESMSVLSHVESMERGVLLLGDLWYFAVLSFSLLVASVYVLMEKRA